MKRLMTKNQQVLLRLFYTNPGKSFYMQEIGRIVGKKPGVFQRTLNGFVASGFLKSEYRARSRYFQVNQAHPLFKEMKNILAKTAGVKDALKVLVSAYNEIKTAILYGSFAKGAERDDSDIDLILVVSRPSVEDKILKPVAKLEKELQREINYKIYSLREFRTRRRDKDPFLEEVFGDSHVVLKGGPDAI